MSTEVVHRLGVAMGIVVALGWVVRSLDTVRRRRRVRQRLTEVLVRPVRTDVSRPRAREVLRRWLPEVAVVCAGLTVGGGGVGLGLGLAGVAVLWWWRRRQQATDSMSEAEARAAARQLPLAADLLAACIAAGAGPVIAAQAVGEALDGPVGKALARGAAEVRMGGEPSDAWRMLASAPGADALARLLERADVSGLPAAVPVARIAADTRADWARAGTARARRAAVLVAAPVGLCFLPAFIAVGIVPVVIGLAGGVLGGGGP
ncbi:type II secretion system F family protein [Streptomyces phaeoluteigriseus]|uniref:Type II secretion system F family protein n=1 Tax=Streptomyces phaeoluteigriseus TaxID=114686 RepID=A0ABY4Z116_9ACTN|nr:type II secretion system F family protein [Streptomyces phaeoluteigriseus]USQ82666.1 type II secretion system F family protein [Streptomyces phaeoluteigriseus]